MKARTQAPFSLKRENTTAESHICESHCPDDLHIDGAAGISSLSEQIEAAFIASLTVSVTPKNHNAGIFFFPFPFSLTQIYHS